ncbi:hypothetical protein FRC09_001791 [Ceratobasidium sp. 395]|nr:hypothetical protein FRC09_001791 [Ceratobasidium sp. 395]
MAAWTHSLDGEKIQRMNAAKRGNGSDELTGGKVRRGVLRGAGLMLVVRDRFDSAGRNFVARVADDEMCHSSAGANEATGRFGRIIAQSDVSVKPVFSGGYYA